MANNIFYPTDKLPKWFLPYQAVNCCIFILGIIGNIVVFYNFCKPSRRGTTTSVFLRALMIFQSVNLISRFFQFIFWDVNILGDSKAAEWIIYRILLIIQRECRLIVSILLCLMIIDLCLRFNSLKKAILPKEKSMVLIFFTIFLSTAILIPSLINDKNSIKWNLNIFFN